MFKERKGRNKEGLTSLPFLMVTVAQLVEHLIVDQEAGSSNLLGHPMGAIP